MCFSATANFVASGVIGGIGVAVLPRIRQARAALFAVTPLLFVLHQFTEGFVWLGLDGRIGEPAFGHVVFLFMLYAQGVLPLLIPLTVLLMEPPGWRRRAVAALTAVGGALAAWVCWAVVALPTAAFLDHHSIAYRNAGTDHALVGAAYIAATCGALLLSTHRVVRWFGILNAAGLAAVLVIRGYAFTSAWCLYAAILSVMVFWQFSRGHVDVERPNRTLAAD